MRSNDNPTTARNSSCNRVHRHHLELKKALFDLQNWRWGSYVAFWLNFDYVSIAVSSYRRFEHHFRWPKLCFGASLRQKKTLFICLVISVLGKAWEQLLRNEDEMFETRMITCCFPNDYQFKLRLFLSPLSKMSKMKTKCQIKMMLFLSAGVPYISTIIVTGGIVKNLRLELHLECVKLKTGIKYYKN